MNLYMSLRLWLGAISGGNKSWRSLTLNSVLVTTALCSACATTVAPLLGTAVNPGVTPQITSQPLAVLSPTEPRSSTSREFVNVLARTANGATATVNGVAAPVFATGVFVRDKVPLAIGMNTLTIEVTLPGGERQSRVIEVTRLAATTAGQPTSTAPPPSPPSPPSPASPLPLVEMQALFVTAPGGADLTWGVHDVRLGGPNLAELPAGVLLRATGQQGEYGRVQLGSTEAWVPLRSLQVAATGTTMPRHVFTTLSVAGATAAQAGGVSPADVVTIPWPSNLPSSVRSAVTPEGWPYLEVDLYGTHNAATWVTHRTSAQVVREATVDQVAPQHVRVRITLKQPHLWGWRIERDAHALRVVVHAPPTLAQGAASPLQGLLIALEAGHGGPTNLGAVGATGVPEKDVNRWTVQALKAELEGVGARVMLVREGDENPSLRERAERVNNSDAQLFISVHANSADTHNGYLRAAGTSTYYKHSHSRDLAVAIQRRLLSETALPDFGVVGGFNYAPIRLVSHVPAVLVEQAFMSHPGEEALLLDAAFRARLAKAVRLGLEDHLRR